MELTKQQYYGNLELRKRSVIIVCWSPTPRLIFNTAAPSEDRGVVPLLIAITNAAGISTAMTLSASSELFTLAAPGRRQGYQRRNPKGYIRTYSKGILVLRILYRLRRNTYQEQALPWTNNARVKFSIDERLEVAHIYLTGWIPRLYHVEI